jgi:hypothetical protein
MHHAISPQDIPAANDQCCAAMGHLFGVKGGNIRKIDENDKQPSIAQIQQGP